MSNMLNFYYMQPVSESELDLGFELLEQADRDLASDVGIYGIISGAEPVPHNPVPDLTVDLTAPCRAYDRLGQRIYFATEQNVDCSLDSSGIPTAVHADGKERWLAIFLKFDRLESDPRTDGNSQRVYFRRDESYQIVVRQGPEGPEGSAPKVSLEEDGLLVCDVRRTAGQTQIREVDIDTSRRQNFIFAEADAVEVISGAWGVIQPAIDTVQGSLDSVDEHLTGHFSGSANRHAAADIDATPRGFIAASHVQGALDDIVDKLSSALPDAAGASLIGSDGEGGTPHALTTSNVHAQLGQLLGWINAHLNKASGAHNASAVSAAAHQFLSSPSVQGQLQQLVDTLASQTATPGASRIGNTQISQTAIQIAAGNLSEQLIALAGQLGTHITTGNHDLRYYTKVQADGQFALNDHEHNADYLRQVGVVTGTIASNAPLGTVGTVDVLPESISLSVKYTVPLPDIYFAGSLLNEMAVAFSENGASGYDVKISNGNEYELEYTLRMYGRG